MLKESTLHILKRFLPPGRVLTDRATLISYEADGGLDKGLPEAVVFPRSREEVIAVMRWAAVYGVPLIARGAGTGLSGGAVAEQGGMIVEFVHMNRLQEIDAVGRSAVVEPALINLRLDERAQTLDLYFPPDPSSQRASTMGGNVAENSGGPHCFKYGVTTNYVIGMQVVLSDGECIQVGGRAFDYPEYDFCGLITGSEGMLALLTSISLRLLRRPPAVKTLLAIFDSVEQAGVAVSAVIAAGLMPATMEMMDQQIVRIIEPFAHANLPLDAGAVLIIEFDGYPESLDGQLREVLDILESHGGKDMRVARTEEERAKIWLARKSAAGAIAREVPAQYTVDITVPRSRLAEMLMEANRVGEELQLRMGHVFHAGDGNLHPMLLVPEPGDPVLMARIHAGGREMARCCVAMGGSITGEHGVGIEKRDFMPLMHNAAEMLAMWDIKQVFDPRCLLNPGKIFPLPAPDEPGPYAGYIPLEQQVPAVAEITNQGYTPATAEEAARQLQALTRARQPVTITSAPLAAEQIGPRRYLSTSALQGISTYAPEDLSMTVGAGTPLTEIHTFLRAHGKHVPLVAPWPDMTIGDLVASNVNAPLRMRYGAVRDIVLCATVALADGRVIRTGRPIVKNVAGFDLTKVFVGSYGTLGLLTDISLKVLSLPRCKRTLLFPVEDLSSGLRWGQEMLHLALTASAVVLISDVTTYELTHTPYTLAYTAEGVLEDVEAELAQVQTSLLHLGAPQPVLTETLTGSDLWSQLIGAPHAAATCVVRIGIPARDLVLYSEQQAALLQEGTYIVDIANGFIYVVRQYTTLAELQNWLDALRQPALALGGYVLVMAQPAAMRGQIDCRGYQPGSQAVMQRLKAQWDPAGILNSEAFILTRR
ncbi:FAD-binding oxidoreductase [Dictyobacter arantiisoli]|uniref:Lactate dehydrogenase n=1 Tax=Dictyobacter arantiisoli TaxID=2014874 RepID=A0A5A5T5X4_9CHLR|nr:FAD-linked oxidase C-terminal domain-containing protein [Dictyobacter arantiisoli]GCF06840.1 lactate dehydrogenase [Dictyobacter arantiisoli]